MAILFNKAKPLYNIWVVLYEHNIDTGLKTSTKKRLLSEQHLSALTNIENYYYILKYTITQKVDGMFMKPAKEVSYECHSTSGFTTEDIWNALVDSCENLKSEIEDPATQNYKIEISPSAVMPLKAQIAFKRAFDEL